MGLEMIPLAALVTSLGHGGCQVVRVSSGEMTLVRGQRADHGWSHHNYFINTHRHETEMRAPECTGAINGQSFIFRGDRSERVWPGPFITRVINCGEITAESARGDGAGPGGATLGLSLDNPGPGVIRPRLTGHRLR